MSCSFAALDFQGPEIGEGDEAALVKRLEEHSSSRRSTADFGLTQRFGLHIRLTDVCGVELATSIVIY